MLKVEENQYIFKVDVLGSVDQKFVHSQFAGSPAIVKNKGEKNGASTIISIFSKGG
jgi:hypothetical protein